MGCWRNKIEDNFPQTSPCDDCLFYKSKINNKKLKDSKKDSNSKIKILTYICDKNQNIYRTYRDQACNYYSKSPIQNK